MNIPVSHDGERALGSEALLQRVLIDRMLVVSAIFAVIAMLSAHMRAMSIGWTYRDLVQFLVVAGLVALALIRARIAVEWKAPLLVAVYVVGGLSGVCTLGMLGGTVFLFPVAAVLVALLCPPRVTLWFAVLLLLLCSAVGVGFCSGLVDLAPSLGVLMTSYLHWAVYVACIGLFLVVACMTILGYRHQMRVLLEQLSDQRDRLEETNAQLVAAANDVKRLSGMLPICSCCKRVRDDEGYWEQIECYVRDHSEAEFTHGICPDCMQEHYPGLCDPEEDQAGTGR
ncbi:MAG: hypothetical protein HN380_31565 [Victivallales bacterium]|nr:hypothetical protein [Victivallales bacterium]